MKIKKFVGKKLQNNAFLLINKNEALVIDIADCVHDILEYVNKHKIKLVGCLITHSHFDHYYDLKKLMNKKENLKIYVNVNQLDLFLNNNLSVWLTGEVFKPKKSYVKTYSKNLEIKNFEKLTFISMPGHTKGSVVFKYDQHYFTGDFLFYDSIGRTDLPTGDGSIMQKSLNLFTQMMQDNFLIYPGHGLTGTFKTIKKSNPFL